MIHTQLVAVKPSLGKKAVYAAVLVLGLGFGIIIELAQGIIGRDSSWRDLIYNLLGLLVGLILINGTYIETDKSGRSKKKRYLEGVALVMFVLGLLPLLQLSWHYIQQEKAFPVIMDLKAQWSDSFVLFGAAKLEPYPNKVNAYENMSRVQFEAGAFPGVSVLEPVPNWSAYHSMRFKVYSRSEEAVNLMLRVHDKMHNNMYQDRFNRKLVIHTGVNEIVISLSDVLKGPVARDLDLHQVAGLMLFLNGLSQPQFLEVSHIYLE